MSRIICILLLVAVLAPAALAFVPVTAGFSSPDLPACCRRDGKHHCASAMNTAPQGNWIKAEAPACPFRSTPSATSKVVQFSAPGAQTFFAAAISGHAITAEAKSAYRFSAATSHLKRGPPSNR